MTKDSDDYKDLLNLIQGLPQGIANYASAKVEGRINGALADWIAQHGWQLKPKDFELKAQFSNQINENWKKVETGLGLQMGFKEGRLTVTGMAKFDNLHYKSFDLKVSLSH